MPDEINPDEILRPREEYAALMMCLEGDNQARAELLQLVTDRDGFRMQLSKIATMRGHPSCLGIIGGPINVKSQTDYVVEAVRVLISAYGDRVEDGETLGATELDLIDRLTFLSTYLSQVATIMFPEIDDPVASGMNAMSKTGIQLDAIRNGWLIAVGQLTPQAVVDAMNDDQSDPGETD